MNQQAKNKNPLLSCALTGGFEDLSTGIVLTTAEKPVFTIGNAPVITDTDNFSEVSLDRDGNSSEVGQPSDLQTDLVNPYYASPLAGLDSYSNIQTLHDLQPPPTLDINSNNQQPINDGNINPIAAFGTAASTVFSTFSSIIKGSTSQSKIEDQSQQQLQEQSFNNETYQDTNNMNLNSSIPPSNPYGFNIQPDSNAPLPSFFSPDDNLLFNKQPPKIDASSGNSFRLGGNKKTYAHIPGLSSTQTQSQNVPQNFNLNPVMPPLPPQTVTHVDSMPNFQPPPPLQSQQTYYDNNNQGQGQTSNLEKSTNKFSFSSLLDKIPVSMNLFGVGSEQSNNNENTNTYNNYHQNNDFNHVTSPPTATAAAAMFQTEPINYFAPQTQMAVEPQIINPVQQQTTVNDYFNNTLQNFASPGITTTTDSIDIIQKTNVTQISPENNNIQTVNFFNPQQFNTKPFAKVQQPFETTQKNIDNSSVMTSPSAPPMMPNNQFIQSTAAQNYSTPPITLPTTFNDNINYQQSGTNENAELSAPPIFFNPTQASELFKPRSGDEGKSKNPYSNNRMRGVGLYRARTSSSSDSSSTQQMFVPMAPSSQLTGPTSIFQQHENIVDHPKESSRPPSIPLIEQNTLNMTPSTTTNFMETTPQAMNFNNMPQQILSHQNDLPPPVQKKSDLNVPESENVNAVFEQEQKIHEQQPQQSNVSNFFAYENSNKVNEVSPLSFFQVQPEMNSQPVVDLFSGAQKQEDKLVSHNDSLNAINFFTMDAPKSEPMQQCIENKMDEVKYEKKEEIQEFNTPISTSSTMQGNDLVNDITDKMESLSACSRSTLSLFATSELDSTMGQKLLSSAPVESLIPKYLEQQPPIGENLKTGSRVNEGHNQKYRPIYWHWFYQNLYWHPFSMSDSMAIDHALTNGQEFVYTSGGRFEVNIKDRRRSSIYWTSGSNAIRKCSWFYMDEKNGNQNLIPYEESVAEYLEKEYEKAMTSGTWNHKIHLPNTNDVVVMKNSGIIEHHKMEQILVVKRGIDEFDIDDGEEGTADHLIIVISGFGDKIDENADEVRSKCMETIQQYYSEAFDRGQIKRIEVLPIILNSIDVLKMNEINNNILNALPCKSPSREINENIMRTMLYSNENFYQKIMNHLAFSLNEIVSKFNQRNANFVGEISVMSSSYEALFLFDMLVNDNTSEFWNLNFEISQFFACGIPTSLLMIRNGEKLKHGFELKRCKKFLNIIHPADDIAQRIEPLVIPEYTKLPPESIENLTSQERIDFILPEDSNLDKFNASKYFSSEILIRRITNEIYGANHIEMDSGSL